MHTMRSTTEARVLGRGATGGPSRARHQVERGVGDRVRTSMTWRRAAGAAAVIVVAAVAVLLPGLTPSVVVSVLGGIAALVALAALAAIVRLVVTDLAGDAPHPPPRRPWFPPRAATTA